MPHDRTVKVPAPKFNVSGHAWRPYQFKNLEKVSKAQMLLSRRLDWLVPPEASGTTLAQAVAERMEELFEEKVSFTADHIHVVRPKNLKKYLGTPTFMAVLAPAPHKSRGILEVDLSLAHAAIDLLLGGASEPISLRPLTDIEDGVMGFVVLAALKALAPNLDSGLPRIRMEGVARTLEDALMLLGEETQVLVLQLKARLGTHAGFIRLFVPSSVLSMTTAGSEGAERRARRMEDTFAHLGRVSAAKTWLRVEIGQAEINAQDLAGLQGGDVVLMDDITARPHEGEGGTGSLRVGMGRAGKVPVEIFLEDGRFHAKVLGFELGDEGQPRREPGPDSDEASEALQGQADAPGEDESLDESEEEMGEEATQHQREEAAVADGDAQSEGLELLNDIPLHIAVELARIPASAEDVIALKVGQILDLNRVPGEPVELSVQGKVVARGELVEVEGHLGVRILSLAG
jgi:type III secretion system YscQ/HrcQ family protein